MKRILLLAALVTAMVKIASADRYVPTQADVERFYKTKTYVVLQNNPMSEFNMRIKEAVEKSWTITPYEFITATQFDEMRKDPEKSFIVLIQVKFPGDKIEASYSFLSVLLGSAVKKITDMPEICGIPISYASVDEYSWAYKTKAMVLFLQNHIQLMKEKPEIISSNMFDYYNKSRGDIHTKELWVVEKDLAKEARSLATLRKYYTYPIKVVKPEDIQEAIEKNDTNVVFLHKVGPEGTRLQARCYVMIIGIGENKLYYWNYHMIKDKDDDGLLIKDLKKLER
jgi:hypothetical protein